MLIIAGLEFFLQHIRFDSAQVILNSTVSGIG